MLSDTTRTHILVAAKRLFVKIGFKKTSMDDIAREANLSKATLYNYFPSKNEMLQGVIFQIHNEFKELVLRELEMVDDYLKKVKRYIDCVFTHFRSLREIEELTDDTVAQLIPIIKDVKKQLGAIEHQFITGILKKGMDKGEIKKGNTDIIATAISALHGMKAFYFISQKNPDVALMDSAAEFLSEAIYNHLKP